MSFAFSKNHISFRIASCILDNKHLKKKFKLHFKNIIILKDVTPFSPIKGAKISANILPAFFGSIFLNKEAGCSSETSVYFYETTWRHVSKDGHIQCYHNEYKKFRL
jgi:hypothetical protein